MINNYIQIVKDKFKDNPSRYTHIMGVYKDAVDLAKIYNVNIDDAKIASLFHDYLKDDPIINQKKYINLYNQLRFKNFKENYHALAAAKYIRKHFKIKSKNIINAIKYHVTLRKNLTTLDKIIYIADYTEESRIMEDKRTIFDIATKDLDQALYLVLDSTINYLKELGIKPYYRQIKTHKYLKERVYEKPEHSN